jgi:hypothetical protein
LGGTEPEQFDVGSGVIATWYLSTLYWELKDGDQLMVILKFPPTELIRREEAEGSGGGPEISTHYYANHNNILCEIKIVR